MAKSEHISAQLPRIAMAPTQKRSSWGRCKHKYQGHASFFLFSSSSSLFFFSFFFFFFSQLGVSDIRLFLLKCPQKEGTMTKMRVMQHVFVNNTVIRCNTEMSNDYATPKYTHGVFSNLPHACLVSPETRRHPISSVKITPHSCLVVPCLV